MNRSQRPRKPPAKSSATETFNMDSLESLFSLRGHRGLVTGASSGLGVECAKALAMAGADVALVARREDRVTRIADELARARRQDDRNRRRRDARGRPQSRDGRSGGGLGRRRYPGEQRGRVADRARQNFKREAWDETIAVNLTAPMMLAQRVARRLIEIVERSRARPDHQHGFNLRVGRQFGLSAVGIRGDQGGLANLTRQLAVEWAATESWSTRSRRDGSRRGH